MCCKENSLLASSKFSFFDRKEEEEKKIYNPRKFHAQWIMNGVECYNIMYEEVKALMVVRGELVSTYIKP